MKSLDNMRPVVCLDGRHRMLGNAVLLVALASFCCVSCTLFSDREHQLTVKVIAPPSTPKESRLVAVGNDSEWGNWNPANGLPLHRDNDSVWSLSVRVPRDFALEFKVTRGSWDTEALFQPRRRSPNISAVVHSDTVIMLRPVGWADPTFASGAGILGTVRYHHALESEKLRCTRDIIVWLPPSYFKMPALRYPVLYMHDGQNIVDPGTSTFGYDWQVDEVADSLIGTGAIREIIVVGIYNTPDREQEYSGTMKGRNYAEFVATELKPLIDRKYRTLPDRAHTAVMGASAGGLISFLFVWWHPEVFSHAACLSSAFSYDAGNILDQVRSYNGPRKDIRVYLDAGSAGADERLMQGTEEMFSLLRAKGYREGEDIVYFFDKGADHNEQAWAARLWRPLTFMFGTRDHSTTL